MIRQYVDEALKTARYDKLGGGTFYGKVPRLRGVMTTASTLERCREQLGEVIEEWVLIRVAKRLPIPRLGKARVKVQLVADAPLGPSPARPPRSVDSRRRQRQSPPYLQ